MRRLNKKVIILFVGVIVICIALLLFLLLKDNQPKSTYSTEVSDAGIETIITNMDFQKLELDTLDTEATDYVEMVRATLNDLDALNDELANAMNQVNVENDDMLVHEHLFNYYNRNLQIILTITELTNIYDQIEALSVNDVVEIKSNYESALGKINRIVELSEDAEYEKNIWLEALRALEANSNN